MRFLPFLLIAGVLLLLSLAGTVSAENETNETEPNISPKASINYISPDKAEYGEIVHFNGSGQDDDGYIVSYQWYSDLDSLLSTSSDFSTANLSAGSHRISFRAQDNDDNWSYWDYSRVNVFDDNETISISVNVPMKVKYLNSQYIESLNETKIEILEREVLVTQTDSQVEWVSMDIATGENFTFTFIADNLVNGTEYSFSYEIINAYRGNTLDNASHLFIANNTEEYSYNLGGQFPDTGWENCTKVQVKVGFVKNPNSDNGILEELASFSTNNFYASGHKYEVCNSPVNDPGFLIPSVSVISTLISIGLIARYRRK